MYSRSYANNNSSEVGEQDLHVKTSSYGVETLDVYQLRYNILKQTRNSSIHPSIK